METPDMASDDGSYAERKADLSRRQFLGFSMLTTACAVLSIGDTQRTGDRGSSRIIIVDGWVLQESDLDQ